LFCRAASMNPAIGMFMPATVSKIFAPRVSPGQPPPFSKCSNRAFVAAKVLVSCWKEPMAIFILR
jgi:hypothetical protein